MPEWFDFAVNFTVSGLLIVFGALTVISLTVMFIRKIDDKWQQRETAQKEAAVDREQNIDTTTVVLIAAAASTIIRGRFHIRSIRRLLPAGAPSSPWSSQGRAVLLGSHVVPKKR